MYEFLLLSFLAFQQSCDYVSEHACVTSACGWNGTKCGNCISQTLTKCKDFKNCYIGLNNTCRPSEIVFEEDDEGFGFGVFVGISISIVLFVIVYFLFRNTDYQKAHTTIF